MTREAGLVKFTGVDRAPSGEGRYRAGDHGTLGMKISVMRDATVSAFAVTVDELAELHGALCKEFPDDELTDTRIEITDDDVDYDFSSFDDLRENYPFEKSVTDFRLEITSLERSIEIGKPLISFTGVQVEVSARSDSVAWCDGVISLATFYLKKKRVWYHRLLRTRSVVLMFTATSIAVAYGYSRYVPVEYNLDFLAVPVGVMAGLVLLALRPKKMSVATLREGVKRPSFPTIPLIQLAISIALLLAAIFNIVLRIRSL